MCTVVIYSRVWPDYPLVVAANRDEYDSRPWAAPGHHWPDAPRVFAPIDEASGGSWLGTARDDDGRAQLVCAVLNQGRAQSLGTDRDSRGALVIGALAQGGMDAARAWLERRDVSRYLPFHVVLADRRDAVVLSTEPVAAVSLSARSVAPGVHIVSSWGLDGDACPKARRLLPGMRGEPPTDPSRDDWRYLRELLATPARDEPRDGLWVQLGDGYGTRSSGVIALGASRDAFLHSEPGDGRAERPSMRLVAF